jgi:hypothetical protein
MSQSFDGPVDINGGPGQAGLLRVNGPVVVHGYGVTRQVVELAGEGDIECGHIQAKGNKSRGEPAANFGSHVGVEGNIDVTEQVNAKTVRAQNVEAVGNNGPCILARSSTTAGTPWGPPAGRFEGNVQITQLLSVDGGIAVSDDNEHGTGVEAFGARYGVYARCTDDGGAAISGDNINGHAGFFIGKVTVTGELEKAGGGFKIDHPLDPDNKYLSHSFVESPTRANLYQGRQVLDSGGEATVTLPDWFEALNTNFHYQLTSIGTPAPNLHIVDEITDNHFRIAGGSPDAVVSWQVTATRKDQWALDNPLSVEGTKERMMPPQSRSRQRETDPRIRLP